MKLTKKTFIAITDHVVQRVGERFSDRFGKYTSDKRMLKSLIIAQVGSGVVLDDWKRVPFYFNKISSEFGPNTELVRKSGVYYICRYCPERDRLYVITAVHRMLYYPTDNSVAIPTSGGAKWIPQNSYHERVKRFKSKLTKQTNVVT